jgi:hypothetical protein
MPSAAFDASRRTLVRYAVSDIDTLRGAHNDRMIVNWLPQALHWVCIVSGRVELRVIAHERVTA